MTCDVRINTTAAAGGLGSITVAGLVPARLGTSEIWVAMTADDSVGINVSSGSEELTRNASETGPECPQGL